ncbi:hypothetical protein L0128_15415, partial [candidate division KSB1 bacterium]|nr:hypothetical protein [candidate division KSB1 bacterium]
MKTFMLILFQILLCISASAQHSTHILLSLDGAWKFALDSANVGVKEQWPHGIPTSRARQVTVPHTWNIEPGAEEYAGTAWYQKEVKIDDAWKQKALHLKFQAVYHDAIVYLNGTKVGENLNSGYTPFQIDITPCVQFNHVNTLVVQVNNAYSATMFPYQKSFDWMNDGGIIRPVSLEVSGKPALQSVHITPTLNVTDSTGAAGVAVKLWETNLRQATVTFVFKEKSTGTRLQSKTAVLRAEQGVFTAKFKLGKIKPWHFDTPALYTLETSVAGKNGITDQEASVFGFKKVEIKGRDFFFNGEKVRLPGLEYMPGSHPKYGAAEPFSYLDSVAHALKDLNVCITRFHWQQDARLLSLFDEYGILVQEEMPWWQSPGNLTPALMQTAYHQWQATIGAHYNHPCIFAWGLSNEVYGNTDKNQYLALRDFVKSLDPSRLV